MIRCVVLLVKWPCRSASSGVSNSSTLTSRSSPVSRASSSVSRASSDRTEPSLCSGDTSACGGNHFLLWWDPAGRSAEEELYLSAHRTVAHHPLVHFKWVFLDLVEWTSLIKAEHKCSTHVAISLQERGWDDCYHKHVPILTFASVWLFFILTENAISEYVISPLNSSPNIFS